MAEAIIRMEDVNKWYGQFHVLRNINLDVDPVSALLSAGLRGRANPR